MSASATLSFPRRPQPIISNGRLGTMLLIGSETVLFGCFISAYMVLRMAAPMWPPTGTPHLQLGLSVFNTGVLLLSSITAFIYSRVILLRGQADSRSWLFATLALGTLFLALQGVEFYRLYAQGLTLQTGAYGAVYYCLISMHGLHVLGGLGYLAFLLKSSDKAANRAGHSAVYWYFVTAVWLVLFSILYIV